MKKIESANRFQSLIEKWLAFVSAGLVVVMMLSIVSEVVFRAVSRRSIPGVIELSEQLMVGIAFLALGYVQGQKGNVRLDMVITRLKGKTRLFFEIISILLCLLVCLLLFSYTLTDTVDTIQVGLITPGPVSWPVFPAKVAISLAFFLVCIRLALQTFDLFKHGEQAL